MSRGENFRDEGVARVNETVADNLAFASWRLRAKQHFLAQLRRGPLTLEDALSNFESPPLGFPPNGMGAIAISLAKAAKITGTGYAKATKDSRHAGVVKIWRLLECAPPSLPGYEQPK